jgi:glycosyltransferase involved in cell wall biosynthesis
MSAKYPEADAAPEDHRFSAIDRSPAPSPTSRRGLDLEIGTMSRGEPSSGGRSWSVVICAHTMDRWDDICDAVRSVEAQEAPPDEIVLVVDHNRVLLERCAAEFREHKVVENHEAKGLSGARNSGIAASMGEIVVFLDDDAVADRAWLKEMAPLFEDPFVAGVGSGAMARWIGSRPRWFPDEFLWVVGCTYRGLETGTVRNGLGCAMALRRSVFERVGGFDARLGRNGSKLPISCEETEFSLRAARDNPLMRFVYAPGTTIEHKVPAERLTVNYFVLRCFAEGISKARVAAIAGGNALTTEKTYVARTLVAGVSRGLREAIVRLDGWAAMRAAAIVAGLSSTIAGYVLEKFVLPLGGARRVEVARSRANC